MIMRKLQIAAAIVALSGALAACKSAPDPSIVPDATPQQIIRVEPPSWWVGMKMPLQLMVQGPSIGDYAVSIEGSGLSVQEMRKAESPNYLFVDIKIGETAKPGTAWLIFTKEGTSFKVPYELAAREEGSAQRKGFTTADFIYLICPDRFANGDPSNDSTGDTAEKADRSEPFGRHGGDLQGIIDHLDYIADLGATAIWCTPLLMDNQPEESYHGYACGDYYKIDPRFGTNELFKEYVSKAREKGLKVIMDIVTNHCGTAHWWMQDLPFQDWIHQFPEYTGSNFTFSTLMDPNASAYDRNLMESGWFVPAMPDMNLDNPFVLRYFQQWAIWWAEYSGLDGFRVDTYPYNEKEPMSRWCEAVMREYPDFNIVGECWDSQFDQLAYWQGGHPNADGFDSHLPSIMDFPLQEAIMAAMGENYPQWGQGMFRVYNALAHDATYADVSKMLVFLSNHDHYRIADAWNQDPAKMKIAYTLLATVRGIPQLFYGDEMMFATGKDYKSDGELRMDFPGGWPGDAVDLFTDAGRRAASGEYADAAALHDYVRTLFQWRKGCEVLHAGKTKHFLSRDNTYAYFRYFDSASGKEADLSRGMVFVYVNNSLEDKIVPWANYAEIAVGLTEGTDVLTGARVDVRQPLLVPASSALVLAFGR
jgi:glycosidase